MKTKAVKISVLSFIVFFAAASLLLAQDSTKNKNKTEKHKTEMQMDKNMNMDMGNKNDSDKQVKDSSIVRSGVIDLNAIDKNKDGKVYQCQMDYNVLSDKPGIDQKCGMKLEKVSLKKARANLMKAGFKVK